MRLTIERGFNKYKLNIDVSSEAVRKVKRFKRLFTINRVLFCERYYPSSIVLSYGGIEVVWETYGISLSLWNVISLANVDKCHIDNDELDELLNVVLDNGK